MTTAPVPVSLLTPSTSLTATRFATLAEIPSALDWHNPSTLSSLYADFGEKPAMSHTPLLGSNRWGSMNREGVTPALGNHQVRMLLHALSAETLKGKRDARFWRRCSIMACTMKNCAPPRWATFTSRKG
jgi:hypothetical protein